MKIRIFLLKAYTHLSLDWKKQDVKLPQLKITPQTNNTTTIKRPIFSSVISFAQILTLRFCHVHLQHLGSSQSEECASNKLILPIGLKMYSQDPWNITSLPISFQARFVDLQFNKKRGETNFHTGNIQDSAKVVSFLSSYINPTRSSHF